MKKIIAIIGLSLTLSSITYAALVNEVKPRLILDRIELINAKEISEDNLYFDITVLRSNQPNAYLRVPQKPMSWRSSLLANVKEIVLWSEPLKAHEKIMLKLSLMDKDIPQINPDDEIGVIQVELKNEQGQWEGRWRLQSRSDAFINIEKNKLQKFVLTDKHGQYAVYLKLK